MVTTHPQLESNCCLIRENRDSGSFAYALYKEGTSAPWPGTCLLVTGSPEAGRVRTGVDRSAFFVPEPRGPGCRGRTTFSTRREHFLLSFQTQVTAVTDPAIQAPTSPRGPAGRVLLVGVPPPWSRVGCGELGAAFENNGSLNYSV